MELDEAVRTLLTAGAGTATVPLLEDLYAKKVMVPGLDLKLKDRNVFRNLVKEIKKSGVDFMPNSGFAPSFNPSLNKIYIPGKTISPGVLAHEWGHALNENTIKKLGGKSLQNVWMKLYGLGSPLASLSTTAALAAIGTGASEDTLRNIGLAGAATQAPRIFEEITASIRGAAKLKKLNMPGKLKAFIGIPTYLTSAALPMMPWLAKKLDPKLQELLNKKEGE